MRAQRDAFPHRLYEGRNVTDEYDAAKDSHDSYYAAIEAKRLRGDAVIKRSEIVGDCVLYLGDAAEILPLLPRVDAVLTDPPYGIGAGTGIGKVTKEGSDFRGKEQWDDAVPTKTFFDQLRAISDRQIICGGNYFDLPPSKCFLVWDKVQPQEFSLAMAEQAWTNIDSPAKIFRWKSMSINGGAPKLHPTQKPENLMDWCVGFLGGARTILDPFMGSGTTLVSCAKKRLVGIGIERDPAYFDIACERIRKAYAQPDMFIESARVPEPTQEALL